MHPLRSTAPKLGRRREESLESRIRPALGAVPDPALQYNFRFHPLLPFSPLCNL